MTVKHFSVPGTVASGKVPLAEDRYLVRGKGSFPCDRQKQIQCVSVDSVISAHGSVKAVADFFKVTPNTVYRWRDAGRIPEQSLMKLTD